MSISSDVYFSLITLFDSPFLSYRLMITDLCCGTSTSERFVNSPKKKQNKNKLLLVNLNCLLNRCLIRLFEITVIGIYFFTVNKMKIPFWLSLPFSDSRGNERRDEGSDSKGGRLSNSLWWDWPADLWNMHPKEMSIIIQITTWRSLVISNHGIPFANTILFMAIEIAS